MDEAEQEQHVPEFTSLPIEWHIPDSIQSQYANNILVQSSPYEIVISFFETQLPPVVGRPEENITKLQEIGSLRADCVARIIVAPALLPSVISALQSGLEAYREAYNTSQLEKKGETHGK